MHEARERFVRYGQSGVFWSEDKRSELRMLAIISVAHGVGRALQTVFGYPFAFVAGTGSMEHRWWEMLVSGVDAFITNSRHTTMCSIYM